LVAAFDQAMLNIYRQAYKKPKYQWFSASPAYTKAEEWNSNGYTGGTIDTP
jgi:hypothetical protein